MDVKLHSTSQLRKIIIIMYFAQLLIFVEGCSIECSCNALTVTCNMGNLTHIPNWIPSNITVLDLSGNPSLKLQKDSFARFTNLTRLRLRYCNLNLPLQLPNNLMYINLEYNAFSMANIAAMFKRHEESHITSIKLNGNNLKLDGYLSVFPKSVAYLDLDDNTLNKIEAHDLKGFTNLMNLRLASTGLQNISKGAFDDLGNLAELYLCSNRIEKLPKGLFTFTPNITYLNLDDNYLKQVPDLKGIRLLDSLNLQNNDIQTVRGYSFGVPEIRMLKLASNLIESFDFTGLKYYILDMSNNRISKIEPGSFGDNLRVAALLLQRNNITSLQRTCFQGLRWVTELHLQSNKLQMIESGTFRNMAIGKLLLFNNSLTTMHGVLEGMTMHPLLLLIFGNPNISVMRTSDYQNMTDGSTIYVSCRSFKVFYSLLKITAKLICSPSIKLKIVTATTGLEGNGFTCNGHLPYECHPCKPGEYDAARKRSYSVGCKKCPYGAFYQDEMAATNCKTCPIGQYVPPGKGPGKSPLDCLTCPKGTDTNISAGYRACHCLPGYSRKYRFGACEKCNQHGFKCQRDYPELRPGYWMSWKKIEPCKDSFTSFMLNLNKTDNSYTTESSYFKCNLPTAQKCPIANSCKGGVEASCYTGYKGVLCAVCDSGYTKQFQKCVKCSSPVVSVTECIAYFMAFVIICCLISKLDNIPLVGRGDQKNERTFADLIQSSLKIVMGFYQVLVRIINAFSSIHWPSTLTHAVKVFEFVELSVLSIPSLHCIRSDWRLSAINEFWISLVALAAIPSFMLSHCALKVAISFCCGSRENFGRKRITSLKNCLQFIVLFFFATYPFISTKIFHVLPASCHAFCTAKENGKCLNKMSYLRNDYSVECPNSTGNRHFNVNYAYLSLLIPFGFPCLLLYLLWRFAPKKNEETQTKPSLKMQREDSSENDEMHYVEWEEYNAAPLINCETAHSEGESVAAFALKMTYGNYKTSCWYWEFIEMIRKLVMVTASSFLLQNVKIGLYSNILLSMFFAILHARKWPMKDTFDNYMQLLALVSVSINLCYSVTKTSSIGDADIMESEKDVLALGVMLVCLNSLLLLLVVGRFVKEVAQKIVKKLHGGCCSLCCNSQCFHVQYRRKNDEPSSLK